MVVKLHRKPAGHSAQPTTTRQTNGPGDRPTGPLQFSAAKGRVMQAFASLKNALLHRRPPVGPHPTFQPTRTGLRGRTTNNLLDVRNIVFGHAEDRRCNTSVTSLKSEIRKFVPNADIRVNTSLQVPSGHGPSLDGFSVSASANSDRLDTSKPVVLFLSGSGGTSEAYGGHIAGRYAGQYDCNVLALNYRGYGQNTAFSPSEKSITQDGFAMINHLLQQGFQPEQIIVHGYSLGASVASRIQLSVESRGFALGGAVYDRPMSSATDSAKAAARQEGYGDFVASIASFGTQVTVGKMSARRNLEDIIASNPEHALRSPTVLVSDTGFFGSHSHQMGVDLGIQHIAQTGHEHEEHGPAMDAILQQGRLSGILKQPPAQG